jgi:hypothetical protein
LSARGRYPRLTWLLSVVPVGLRLFGGYRDGCRLRVDGRSRRGLSAACGSAETFGLGGGMSLSTHGLMPGSVRTSGPCGGLRFRRRRVRCRGLHRPFEGGADGHHDGEPERDDHRPRPDLQEWVSLQVAGDISEPHVGTALPAAPEDRLRREMSGDDIGKGAHTGSICRCFTFLSAFYVDQGLYPSPLAVLRGRLAVSCSGNPGAP